MANPKTRPTTTSVDTFLKTIVDAQRRQDTRQVVALLETLTKAKAQMWGTGIVECGTYQAGKGCIHIKRLSDIDVPTLKRLVVASIEHLWTRYA